MSRNNWTSSSYDWSRELVLITGGSDGIGEGVVRTLSGQGIRVVVLDIKSPKSPFNELVSLYNVDIIDSTALEKVCDKVKAEVGHPSIIVSNAGIALGHSILEESDTETQKLFDINVVSQYALIRHFLPHMIETNHGHVVHIASLASYFTHSRNVSYAASKAAVLAIHEGLTQELRFAYNARKVRTSIVHPYFTSTSLLSAYDGKKGFQVMRLKPATVSDEIVRIILSGESSQIILPHRYSMVAGALKGLPNWLQDGIRNAQGVLLHD